MSNKLKGIWHNNRGFFLFVVLMLVFRSAVADWYNVPTGSMQPTIVEGDRVLVDKMAYDLRIPFTHVSLVKLAEPKRGDIVVFDSKRADTRLIKRVVGIPGDVIEMRQNALFINGQQLAYQLSDQGELSENLLGFSHAVRLAPGGSRLSNFAPVRVPDNHYLALGDNRDNSADSRVIGFVPREELLGRAHHVALSINPDNYYLPRTDRFWQAI
ncbi:signal peptidase I [Aliiglaciecola sp. CAU 1673]|uniref:signal peptidase I n=1 Tax=Aliiglaciecola sp. CAU 1673 TaxID=3032595 RepID=UPI0023DB53BE|nr:signal peptidase I [Aliiglaciecola sp. CAU 1673]MDF2177378.1 signal peptidase I [Aliiglaciecola sp. CAU 1673]